MSHAKIRRRTINRDASLPNFISSCFREVSEGVEVDRFLLWLRHMQKGTDGRKSTAAEAIGISPSLLRFVDDFYGPDLCVIYFRRERKQKFSLSVGMQTVKFTDHRLERPRRGLNDIEILQQHDAIAGDIEDSAADTLAGCGWNQRAKE